MTITSGGAKLTIQSEETVTTLIQAEKFLYSYIPNVSIEDSITAVSLNIVNDGTISFRPSHNGYELRGPITQSVSIKDIITVIDYCLEIEREKIGVFCFHGSAASQNGKTVLLTGGISGLGKTTIALSLCLDHGFSLVGDEKILIDEMLNVIGGVTNINYNKPALSKSIPINLDGMTSSELQKHMTIEAGNTSLALIVQPLINFSASEKEKEEWDELKTDFHVFEEISRKARGISRRIHNFSFPLDSIDTHDLALKRSSFAKNISQNVSAVTLKGNPKSVITEIDTLL